MKFGKNSKSGKFQKLLDKVYRFLSIRPRSEKEVKDYLKKRKAPDDVAEKVFKILREQQLIDDEAFAGWWIEQRSTFRPKGKIGLKAELKQKGIERRLVEKMIGEMIDEESLAKKALEKKIKTFKKLSPREFRQKISTFLSYRGFSWSTIKKILSTFEFLQ